MMIPVTTKCRKCGEAIILAPTKRTWVPLNPEPLPLKPDSHFILDSAGNAHCIGSGPYSVHKCEQMEVTCNDI